MENKVLLAVYSVIITGDKESQMPSNFGGNVDLLDLFKDFTSSIYDIPAEMPRANNTSIALAGPDNRFKLPRLVEEKRELYGYFDTGRNGTPSTVIDITAKDSKGKKAKSKTVASITRDLHITRPAFFYLYVPKSGKKAYIILQRAQSLGIKGVVEKTFQDFMNTKGLQRYRVKLNNLLDKSVFKRMLESGNFKELTIVKEGLPENINNLYSKDPKDHAFKGTQRVSYLATDLPPSWQEWALNVMTGKPELNMTEGVPKAKISIGGEQQLVTDVTIKLELNKKQKTFHLVYSGRDQPDVDVTENVRRNEDDGLLNRDDLVEQSQALVDDINFTGSGSVDTETGEVL
jgi:hypothetical protein